MIPKRDKMTDISRDVAGGKELKEKIMNLAKESADRFMRGENLNDAVADIANREGFNQLQIQRLIEESNIVAYNKKYETVKKMNDRRLSFELAELQKVLMSMGTSAPPEIDNPNVVKGRPGEGEIKKEASYQNTLHRPYQSRDVSESRMMQKTASQQAKYKQQEVDKIVREYNSDIFKIANCLVMTEKFHKSANEVFNTLLDDVSLETEVVEDIVKKASSIVDAMISNKKLLPTFDIQLLNSHERVASLMLGQHSLMKNASSFGKSKEVKVGVTQDVSSYHQLLKAAHRIIEGQQKLSSLFHG